MYTEVGFERVKKIIYEKKIKKAISEDYLTDRKLIAIGCRHIYEQHETSEDLLEDTVYIHLDDRNAQERTPFNALVCSRSGVGKTRFIKRLVKEFYRNHWKILIIEPKSYEMINARKMGHGRRLHPYEKNGTLPIRALAPFFVKSSIPDELQGQWGYYTHHLKDFKTREDLYGLGFTGKSADTMVSEIRKGNYDLVSIQKKISSVRELAGNTKNAVTSSISNLMGSGFFSSKKNNIPILNLEKYWDKNEIVVINYFTLDGKMVNTDLGKVLEQVKNIGKRESEKGLDKVSKKLIVVDDSFIFFNRLSQGDDAFNLAEKNIINAQNNWRTYGTDTLIVTQLPTNQYVPYNILNSCNNYFISVTSTPSAFGGKIPEGAYHILKGDRGRRLRCNEKTYTFEWVWTFGVNQFITFYPYDCNTGHT